MYTFLKDPKGNDSSTRAIGITVILSAIGVVYLMILFIFMHPDYALGVLGVLSGLFVAMTAPTFIWLYNNKSKELTAYFNKSKDASDTDSQPQS